MWKRIGIVVLALVVCVIVAFAGVRLFNFIKYAGPDDGVMVYLTYVDNQTHVVFKNKGNFPEIMEFNGQEITLFPGEKINMDLSEWEQNQEVEFRLGTVRQTLRFSVPPRQ